MVIPQQLPFSPSPSWKWGTVWHVAWKIDPVQEEKAWVASESRLVTGSGGSNGFLCLPQALASGLGVPLSLPRLPQRNLGG